MRVRWSWIQALKSAFTRAEFTQTDSTATATVAAPTAAAPAAITATVVGDTVSTEGTGWSPASEADADAHHVAIDALVADVTAIRAEVVKLVADVRGNKSNINSVIDLLQASGVGT